MITPSLPRAGAIAAVSLLTLTGCAPATLGVSPASVLATVIANIPTSSTTTTTARAPERRRIPSSPAPSAEAASILHTASEYVGVPYVWGGNTPRQGFDCSGFTKYIFAKYGIDLPRTSRGQAQVGEAIPADFRDLRPGDLMMFAEPGQAISHVAIYAGNGRIIHSSSSNGGVGYTDLNTGGDWFVAYFVVARRVL
ncbi:MAG TPA: C40 family peptidase [Gemmatimonadaceae bacterium]|nr:C40 family peptidase [Gemmatimonadaceae bacterium]